MENNKIKINKIEENKKDLKSKEVEKSNIDKEIEKPRQEQKTEGSNNMSNKKINITIEESNVNNEEDNKESEKITSIYDLNRKIDMTPNRGRNKDYYITEDYEIRERAAYANKRNMQRGILGVILLITMHFSVIYPYFISDHKETLKTELVNHYKFIYNDTIDFYSKFFTNNK